MEIDRLDDGSLPIFVASVRQVAIMVAVENCDFGDDERASAEVEKFWEAPLHAWGAIEPRGRVLQERDAIESLLCRDIDSGRLSPKQIRRGMDGALSATDTLIDTDAIEQWARVYGFELGDSFGGFIDDEAEVADKALEAIHAVRARFSNPELMDQAKEVASRLSEDEIHSLLVENRRLKLSAKAEQEKPMRQRERNSLLRIVRALDVMAKLPPRGFASSISVQLQQLGFDGPEEDTIRKAIAAARSLNP